MFSFVLLFQGQTTGGSGSYRADFSKNPYAPFRAKNKIVVGAINAKIAEMEVQASGMVVRGSVVYARSEKIKVFLLAKASAQIVERDEALQMLVGMEDVVDFC